MKGDKYLFSFTYRANSVSFSDVVNTPKSWLDYFLFPFQSPINISPLIQAGASKITELTTGQLVSFLQNEMVAKSTGWKIDSFTKGVDNNGFGQFSFQATEEGTIDKALLITIIAAALAITVVSWSAVKISSQFSDPTPKQIVNNIVDEIGWFGIALALGLAAYVFVPQVRSVLK